MRSQAADRIRMDATETSNHLSAQRSALAESGHLRLVHWCVLGASLLLTLFAWWFLTLQLSEKARLRFDRASNQLVQLLTERMHTYEDGLQSGVAAIHMLGHKPSRDEWRTFATSLSIETRYPGISGIGFIDHLNRQQLAQHLAHYRVALPDYTVHPSHDLPDLYPIVFIEPQSKNSAAVGLDMSHEHNRRAAAERARLSGSSQITGTIYLVQEMQKTPGFLLFVPIYADYATDGGATDSSFLGLVYAPFVVRDLIAGVLSQQDRYVSFQLRDGGNVLYDELNGGDDTIDPQPAFMQALSVPMFGRDWTFEIHSNRNFRASIDARQPWLVLLIGLTIDALLLYVFLTMARNNRRALSLADSLNRAYRLQNRALIQSNRDLEQFATVASHDLKTPLRGIANLTEYLEDDLGDYINSAKCPPEVPANLERLRERTRRLDRLISDLLNYSNIGSQPQQTSRISVDEMIRELAAQFGLSPEEYMLAGSVKTAEVDPGRLKQALAPLIGNAVKHHHDRSNLVIVVHTEEDSDNYYFSIKDNGPGIEPRFHEKIFEVFQTLGGPTGHESTGIGLSVAKKCIESVGGSIKLESTPGNGCVFRVAWPKSFEGTDTYAGYLTR